MAIILDKYAIKEVADVMFYELDSKGAPSAPVLYLDTLKVSTIEQSSETVDATGGKGNVKLLSWDTNKEITLTLEDALFSAKSLGIMFGGSMEWKGPNQEVLKTLEIKNVEKASTDGFLELKIKDQKFYISTGLVTAFSYQDATGKDVTDPVAVASPDWKEKKSKDEKQTIEFVTFDLLDCTSEAAARGDSNGIVKNGMTIDVGAEFDSNTYYITGDTYARNYQSGQDEFLQFIVPKGKVSAEDVSLTMEADGDPATFSMSVKCLKSNSGSMIKLVKYDIASSAGGTGKNKGVASVLDDFNEKGERADWETPHSVITDESGSRNQTTVKPVTTP
jgi:hypothetical protein